MLDMAVADVLASSIGFGIKCVVGSPSKMVWSGWLAGAMTFTKI